MTNFRHADFQKNTDHVCSLVHCPLDGNHTKYRRHVRVMAVKAAFHYSTQLQTWSQAR